MEVGKVYKVRAGHGTKAKLEEKGIRREFAGYQVVKPRAVV